MGREKTKEEKQKKERETHRPSEIHNQTICSKSKSITFTKSEPISIYELLFALCVNKGWY